MTKARGCAAAALGIWIVMLAGALTPAQAYCPTECKRTDPKLGYCIEYGPVGAGCTGPSGHSGPGRSYGAIAYSPSSHNVGYSQEYGNQTQAETRAKKECGQSDCETTVWYYNSCGALATGDDGAWGADHGDDEARAGKAALAQCTSVNGQNCKVIASYCSR
jgi:serine/threonine-protein kinase